MSEWKPQEWKPRDWEPAAPEPDPTPEPEPQTAPMPQPAPPPQQAPPPPPAPTPAPPPAWQQPPPAVPYGTFAQQNDGLAVPALVVGILSLTLAFACGLGLLGAPAALIMGRTSMKRIDASGGRLVGRGMAQAGFIMGIIGTVFLVLTLAVVVLAFLPTS
jgi:hypothetical protein